MTIVMDRTFDKHLKNLVKVLQRISMAGLKLSVKKCAFLQKQVKYLQQLVTADGISKDWPLPQNRHEFRSFLVLCTYYIRFVPNFASMAASLHKLLKKAYQWGESQEKACTNFGVSSPWGKIYFRQ